MSKTRQIKLKDVVFSQAALSRITALPLSARMSFTLGEVVREIAPILEDFPKRHLALLKRYGTPKVNPQDGKEIAGAYDFQNGQQELFQKEYDDLLDAPVNFPYGRIKLADLLKEKVGKDETLALSPQEFYQLAWLLKVELEPVFEDEKVE